MGVFYQSKNSSHREHRAHRENPHQHWVLNIDNTRGAVPLLRRLDVSIKPGEVGEDCLSAKREFRSRPD
jgi:hypothetical protein